MFTPSYQSTIAGVSRPCTVLSTLVALVAQLMLIVIVQIGMCVDVSAQSEGSNPPPCEDPACTGQWYSISRTINLSTFFPNCPNDPSCNITFTYQVRGCNNYCEYYLGGLSFSSPNCLTNCPFSEIMKGIIIAMLTPQPGAGGCVAGPGDCVDNVRVSSVGCWRTIYDVQGAPTSMGPCEGVTACCIATYKICVDAAGNVTVTPKGSTPNGFAPCLNVVFGPQIGGTCGSLCEYFYW